MGVHLGRDLVTVKATAYDVHHCHTHEAIQGALVPCAWEHRPFHSDSKCLIIG